MKGNVLTRNLTSGATYEASMRDYYNNLQKAYEKAKRQQAEYEDRKRQYERELKDAEEKKSKLERERKAYLEKLKKDTTAEEREKAAVRAQEKWGKGETPSKLDADLFEISDYKKAISSKDDTTWYEKAWRKFKDFFLAADGITATGWKVNEIQASQFGGDMAKSREDQVLINMAESYFKGNKTPENRQAVQELNRRKPGFINSAAVYLNKVLDFAGNNSITGSTGAFLGTDGLDKVRINIDFDENTQSEEALQNIATLRNAYKAFDEESYNAYLENRNKAKYYENMLSDDYKRKVDIAEGRIPNENGVADGSVEFFNFSKLSKQLPGIIAGSISSPSQLIGSVASGVATARGILATTTAASAAIAGTGGWGTPLVLGALTAGGAATTYGLNQAQGAHENAAEVDESYISKVKYELDRHPGVAADFYRRGRSILGKDATEEDIIIAKLVNKIPSQNKAIDKAFDDAAAGSQRQYDRDMIATTADSAIDTALEITPLKFFTKLGKSAIKANLRSSRIARAANKVIENVNKLDGGTDGVLRKAFGKYGAIVSGEGAVAGTVVGAALDNVLGRIPKVNTLIKSIAHFDISKIKRLGPKTSNWINYGESILGRGFKSALSEGIEEGKQYYNQQRAMQEFQNGLRSGNLSYETQTILGDVLDDFQAGHFAAAGMVQAITGLPMLDVLHYTDTNIINAAEAIKNIKSGMIGGHGQAAATTAIGGFLQAKGTSSNIDDFELAIRALENNKLAAQRQFAQDQILSRMNNKYIADAIDYLKNSNSIKLSEKELQDLQDRAAEVSGLSKSPYVKALAKSLGIPKEDYHAFVADYMYHIDNLRTEREDMQQAKVDLDAEANKARTESWQIANPSDEIANEWSKNDIENNRRFFENRKSSQVKKLEDHIKSLNDKLKTEALTNSQKAEIQEEIKSTEESLKNAKEAKFDDSNPISYSQARFDRINTVARMLGAVRQLRFLNDMLTAIGEENTAGQDFIKSQINATKKLLNSWLTGNKLGDKQLSADNLADVEEFARIIARDIERGDKDNMFLQGASAELTNRINSLAQAYQEYSKSVLNYNISQDLFRRFVGYDTNEKGEIVPDGTEGSKHVRGNAKQHLEGIIAAQDDDAKLEQAFKQGFSNYGFAGVYKNESPLVQDQEREEEEAKPGTISRRNRIRELGKKIRKFYSDAKGYVSGKWKSFGTKEVFIPDEPNEQTPLDSSENQQDVKDYYDSLVQDYQASDDVEKWLDAIPVDDAGHPIGSNAHLLTDAFFRTLSTQDDITLLFGDFSDRTAEVLYKGVKIGTVTPVATSNKADGDEFNLVMFDADGFSISKLEDVQYLEGLITSDTIQGLSGEQPKQNSGVSIPTDITEQQEAKIQVLNDLAKKMNEKFDVSLRTSSHYFEWVGTGENRKLKLWHRLHDEIGGNFKEEKQDKQNWSSLIKQLYRVVYHNGYSEQDPDGSKDIQALIDYLENFYQNDLMNQRLLENISGYITYLKQEGNDISYTDLYECIKGISETIAPEISKESKNKSLDRGTALDILCRTVLGTWFPTAQDAIEYCKVLRMTNKAGQNLFVKDYFTEKGFEETVEHLWNTRKVYVEDLGYVLWTSPFTIYTEDFKNNEGKNINIAGEVDMIAIDQEGRPIIIDYKTSTSSVYDREGGLSLSFTDKGDLIKSPHEQYTNQQSAYIQMLNETTRKETTLDGGFNCTEARLFPIQLIKDISGSGLLSDTNIQFSKDQQLVLQIIPFENLLDSDELIRARESYRSKLAQLSRLYAKVEFLANSLDIYATDTHKYEYAERVRSVKEDLDSILLCLQEVTSTDLDAYETKIIDAIKWMQRDYLPNKNAIDSVCKKYQAGELELDEVGKASSYNNLDWKDPLIDEDIEKLGGFSAMGVKDRKEYDEKVEELAHISCNEDFQENSSAKLTAVPYKTRQGNEKTAVYASITYKGTTYPPVRIYLSKSNGDSFAKDVLDGNVVSGNIRTTVGLLSKCSDGNQHLISESEDLIEAIDGTADNPYENFMVDSEQNSTVAVVTFNKTTGTLSVVSENSDLDTKISLPTTLKKESANGHVVIYLTPKNSSLGKPIPIICNTPEINESLGVDKLNHRTQSLLDFLVETVLQQLNDVQGLAPLKEHLRDEDGDELPLTYEQILNFFFEPYDSQKGDLIERPQYVVLPPSARNPNRSIKIGNFAKKGKGGARIISLDDTKALKEAISHLSVWISTEMASVQWSSSKKGSRQFNEFAQYLRSLEDGERFYLGRTGIYFDKSDADGTYLGFLAKNGLLTTPFNGFSHPLISINSCQKEDVPLSPALGEDNDNLGTPPTSDTPSTDTDSGSNEDYNTGDSLLDQYASFAAMFNEDEDDSFIPKPKLHKIQRGSSRLDETAARQYVEKVLGKSFVDSHLEFVDEICSAMVGGLSVGTVIAGQVTANMMKLSRYAENGTEYHEAFHWAFELIIDPKESDKIRKIVRKKYGITDQREIAEWLADAYMQHVRSIYTPNANFLRKAFNKIKQWAITFSHIFTDDYQIYKLFNDINSGKFVNKPINNEAVIRFQEKFKHLNSETKTGGYEKDGVEYEYQQGPVDHEENIKQLVFFALTKASFSPAVNYVTNTPLTINIADAATTNYAKAMLMMDHYEGGKFVKGLTTKQLVDARKDPKKTAYHRIIDNALALRELLDEKHIQKTQEYVSARVDEVIGVKGKDLSVNGKDDSSDETTFDQTYSDSEAGDYSSNAGSPAEHIVPDHQISRISKTSSRAKLFFATIPIMAYSDAEQRYVFSKNKFGKLGYYELHDIYQTIQNRYHHVLSQTALWNAIEADSKSNPQVYSLWLQISKIKDLASKGNNNAIGLLNEIYKDVKSTKQSHEVIKTRLEQGAFSRYKISYKPVNIMVLNNSYAISRNFTDTVLGGFNKFYEQVSRKENGREITGVKVRSKIYNEVTGKNFTREYRDAAYLQFFDEGYKTATMAENVKNGSKTSSKEKTILIYSLYSVIISYGTKTQKPFYYQYNDKWYEGSIEDYLPYIKYSLTEALSAIGIDVTTDQIDDILETQFGGTGIMQLKQLLTSRFALPEKGNTHKIGSRVTLYDAVRKLYTTICSEEAKDVDGVIWKRQETEYLNGTKPKDGTKVFRNQQAHVLLSSLLAQAHNDKYEVSGRGVDGKIVYAMSDDNTVTAMCDVIFDKTGDYQCAEIRDMILNDPFNISNGSPQFGNIPVGSYILPRVLDEITRVDEIRDNLKTLTDQFEQSTDDKEKDNLQKKIELVEDQLRKAASSVDYEIINDSGIETGNNENSSTNADKRGADTIMSTIIKLCQNMIVLAPFADKSTALSVRLKNITIPGIDYDRIYYAFKETGKEANINEDFKRYIQSIDVDATGRVVLNNKENALDRTIAQYVLAEYYQAKKAIQDYEDILRNHALPGSKTEVEEKYKTALNICKKLMFMSQFSGDYGQDQNTGEWVFLPFGVENGANKTDVQAAKEMLSQFEAIVYDQDSLLWFVNRQINGIMQYELKRLQDYGIIKMTKKTDEFPNPHMSNVLLDNNVIKCIWVAINQRNLLNGLNNEDRTLTNEQAIRIFMYDIVGKSIISKQESERLFTGQSNLYNIVRDKETRIITVPYQDQAKRIGSFVSTGTVGVVEDEDYICAEIPDDQEPIKDQVVRSIYMSEIANYIKTGDLNMDEHPGFDFRSATTDQIRELVPKEFRPIVENKIDNVLKGFVLKKKDGSDNLNNVTDGAAFISADFTRRLLKSQGVWNNKIARAFDILNSTEPQDIQQILNSWETFNQVFTEVIGMYKYTAVGFRTENVNGQKKLVQYVNKYALAPVFACMCNSKMDAIRKQMESQSVDVLMFESAVKVGAHGNSDFTVDDDGNTTGHFNTYSQKQFFLRKQLNTDPNEKEVMKIGIQTVKVALSAAIGQTEMEWNGEIVDGDVIIAQIMEDINNLTKMRKKNLMSKLGTKDDVINYVVKFLRGNNVPEDIIKAFQDGIPAEALSIQKHIDTLSAKRIQEDTVRINSPGSAFIQRCVYGMEGPGKFGNYELNDGDALNVVNSDGSMDCVLSIDYFIEYKNGVPYFKLTPKGQKRIKLMTRDQKTNEERPMSFEEIRKWLKDNGIIGKNAKPSILSYRIPTQAVASINALKCVDVIPVVRDTVILPKLFTTITGSDFDIDKLFISTIWYRMEEQEDGSYKPVSIEDSTTEEGASNIVVEDYINILCSIAKKMPEVFYMSIDQDTKLADDVISQIKKLYPPTENDKLANASGILQAMPSMQAKVHDEFLAGRQGIGPFALALTNHVLTRIYRIGFNSDGIYLRNKSLSRDKDDDGKSIMSWLSAMINKHVDVAKNPDITYLNVNDSTFNVVALLLRLGYGKRTFMFTCQDIMRDYAFGINQETAVCKYSKNDSGYTDARKQAYDKIMKQYGLDKDDVIKSLSKYKDSVIYEAACREIFDKNIDNKSLCEYVLENHGKVPEGIIIRIGKEDFKLTDSLFKFLNLQLFNYLSDFMAKPLTALQQATVIDNERCITSMIQSEFYKQAVAKVKEDKTFYNLDKLFEKSYIDDKINAVTDGTDAIYEGSSCMDKAVIVTIAKAIDPKILSYGKDRMNTFLGIIRDGMVAYYGAKFFDTYCKENNIDVKKLLKSGSHSIFRRLAEIQASARSNRGKYRALRNNLLIQGLSIESVIGEEFDVDPGLMDYNKLRFMDYEFLRFLYAGQSDDNILADVQQAWNQLLNYGDEKIQEFARDLIVYSFYTSGEMSGNTKLFKYVPPSWRISSGYGEYFKKLSEDKEHQYEDIDDIIDKLCRNLWYKEKFVRTISLRKLVKFQGSDILKHHTTTVQPEAFGDEATMIADPIFSPVIAGIEYTDNGVYPIFKGDKDQCPRYLKCYDPHHEKLTHTDDSSNAWTLYKLVGFKTYVDANGGSWSYPVYVQTSVLGEKYYRNNIFEFDNELEENNNLDAYGVIKEFLSKLGSPGHRNVTSSDVDAVTKDLEEFINTVNMGVNLVLTGEYTDIANQTVDILVDKDLKTTFQPINTRDQFTEEKQKQLAQIQKKLCKRP